MAKEKKEKKKVKKPRYSLYKEGKTENKSCPKCGSGYLLAEHSNRRVCGKCRYMETKSK